MEPAKPMNRLAYLHARASWATTVAQRLHDARMYRKAHHCALRATEAATEAAGMLPEEDPRLLTFERLAHNSASLAWDAERELQCAVGSVTSAGS